MEVDDSKHLYEVDQYDGKDEFPQRPVTSLQIHDSVPAGRKGLFCLVGIQVFIILILIILLGINGVTLTHLNTVDTCDSTGASTGASTGGLTSNDPIQCNCTGVASSNMAVAAGLGQLVNMTRMTSGKVDGIIDKVNGIVDYTTNDAMATENMTNLLGQVGQLIAGQLGQVMSQVSDTTTKVENIQDFADQQVIDTQNISDTLQMVLQKTGDSANKLTSIVGSLSNVETNGITTASVVNDILVIAEELLELQNASSLFNSIRPVSCKDIKAVQPNSPSGWYHVNSRTIYCNMDTLCNSTEGWTRIGYLDMTDATQSCPSGFRLYQSGGVRACGRTSNSPSCSPIITFPTNGVGYTQICGRVKGYQKGSTDAIYPNSQHNNIDSYYLDGVSITRGHPREHIWSFICGVFSVRNAHSNCPCNTNAFQANYVQSFIGDNYYCESGNPNTWWSNSLYPNDPLWDGQQCPSLEAPCCTNPNLPWFFRDFGNATSTQDLEMRVCGDEGRNNEDNPVGEYEIYIK